MHTSYSALNTYKTCPRKYKYSEVDKLKTPKRVEQVFGTVVHAALKYAFERKPLYPTVDEVIDYYTRAWGAAAEKIVWQDESKKEAEAKIYFEEGVNILKNFLKKNKPWSFNAVDLEGRFTLPLEDEERDEKHTIGGVIDRIDKDPETRTYEIIDYKTGKKMPSQDMVDEDLQLDVYSLALVSRWPQVKPEEIKTSLYFLKHNEKISSGGTPEKLVRAKKRILTIIREIEKALEKNDFPPIPSGLCNYCEFRPICPMWAHEYKKEEEINDPDEREVAEAIDEFFALKEEDAKRKKRAAELRDTILTFMEKKDLARVFGGEGYITKTIMSRVSYDTEKIKDILESEGLWEKVLKPDPKLIEKMVTKLPEKSQEKIAPLRTEKKSILLKQTKKKSGS